MNTKQTLQILLMLVLLPFAAFQKATAQCSVSAGNDTTIYNGYGPMSCAVITATATGTSPITFLWSNGDTASSISVCDTAQTTYVVSITDASGCTASDTITVFVTDVRCGNSNNKVLVCHIPPGNPANAHTICISQHGVAAHLAHGCVLGSCPAPPVPPCSVNLGNDIIACDGGPVVLDAGSGFSTYLWGDGSGSQTLSVSASGSYSVIATDSTGCVAMDTIEVSIFTGPTADAGPDTTLSEPGCVTLTGSAGGGTPPYSILWSTGDTTASITVCDTFDTSYILMITDSNGCTAADTVSVFVLTAVPSPFVCDSPKVEVCHIPPGNPDNAHTICISVSALAAHLAHGDSIGPCANGQRLMRSGFIFSQPNPFSNRARIQFRTFASGHARVEILNLTGYRVSVLFDGEAEALVPYLIDFSANELPGGIYFARITSGNLAPVVHKMTLMNE